MRSAAESQKDGKPGRVRAARRNQLMRKYMLAAIMAASALVPAAAFAQNDHGHGGWRQHDGNGGGQGRQQAQPQSQPRFERPQGQPEARHFDRGPAQAQPQVQAQPQQPRGNWQGGRSGGWAGLQQQPHRPMAASRADAATGVAMTVSVATGAAIMASAATGAAMAGSAPTIAAAAPGTVAGATTTCMTGVARDSIIGITSTCRAIMRRMAGIMAIAASRSAFA